MSERNTVLACDPGSHVWPTCGAAASPPPLGPDAARYLLVSLSGRRGWRAAVTGEGRDHSHLSQAKHRAGLYVVSRALLTVALWVAGTVSIVQIKKRDQVTHAVSG